MTQPSHVPQRQGHKKAPGTLPTWRRTLRAARSLALDGLCPTRDLSVLYPGHVRRTLHPPEPALHAPQLETMRLLPQYSYLSRSWIPSPDTYATLLDDVLYFPKYGFLASAAHHAIIAQSLNSLHHAFRSPLELYPMHPIRVDGVSSPLRGVSKGFSHTLRDDLPRLTLLGAADLGDLAVQLLYPPPLYDVEEVVLSKVLPPNVQVVPIDPDQVYRLEKVALATFLTGFPKVYFLPGWYLDMLHAAFDLPTQRAQQRLYIPRGEVHRRRVLNEDALTSALQREGFEVFDPGVSSVELQVASFASARVVVSAHSAALGNMMFSRQASLVELFPNQWAHPNFYLLGVSLGQDYHSQHCTDGDGGRDDDFTVDIDALRRVLVPLLSA